jgi:hypothetical protein
MACCGKNRSRIVNASAPRNTQPTLPSLAAGPSQSPARGASQPLTVLTGPYSLVNLRYLEKSPILVRGPATGRQYDFSHTHPVRAVDARDADALLRTRFFRRGS